ncbi:DUF2244 domain-containing protein [Solimonas soli]|uniref:DUF2244 domain-containing protein n=1 Tax=Solimonas soli TaxID=413479 RepID=UPI00146F9C4C|nr:DUF2244 domain-containing protein [Solimonas soli]
MIGPNASLTVGQAWLFFGLMAATGLGVAGLMAARGLWPILPFAGLELAALGTALYVSVRRNGYREVIRMSGETVHVEFGMLGRGASATVSLSRWWTRAVLEPGAHRNAPSRLLLRCAGQRIEIGRCLTEEEREQLHGRLQELLSPVRPKTPGARGGEPAQELPFGER